MPSEITKLTQQDGHIWLGHASVLLRTDGINILFDPFFSEHYGPLRLPGLQRKVVSPVAVPQLPTIDLVVISHDHYDHLDRKTVEQLTRLQPRMHFVVPLGVGDTLRSWEIHQVTELDWYQTFRFKNVVLHAVPAVHESGRSLSSRNRSLWAGYVVESPSTRTYFSGDTADGPMFDDIAERLGPIDTAFIAIGAYGPERLLAQYHLAPEQAWNAGSRLHAARVVLIHWGTMINSAEPLHEPIARFRKIAAGDDRLIDARAGTFVAQTSTQKLLSNQAKRRKQSPDG